MHPASRIRLAADKLTPTMHLVNLCTWFMDDEAESIFDGPRRAWTRRGFSPNTPSKVIRHKRTCGSLADTSETRTKTLYVYP